MTKFEDYEKFEDFISTRIAKLRQQKNISARDMSMSLGLGEAYVNHIENKSNMPSIKSLFYICDFLKVTPKDFFDDNTTEPMLLQKAIDGMRHLSDKDLIALISIIDRLNEKTK